MTQVITFTIKRKPFNPALSLSIPDDDDYQYDSDDDNVLDSERSLDSGEVEYDDSDCEDLVDEAEEEVEEFMKIRSQIKNGFEDVVNLGKMDAYESDVEEEF
jgi:hypothetical protein